MASNAQGRPADPFTERTPRVVSASKLHRAAARRKAGAFLAEGANSVEAAVTAGVATEVFMTPDALDRHAALVGKVSHAGITLSAVTERAMSGLSATVTPPGLVAVCRSIVHDASEPAASVNSARPNPPRIVAIGQALAEPGNVGTLIRAADALGADQVWLTADSADPEGPKAVRASAGSVFHMPVVRGIAVEDVPARVRDSGLTLLVATGDGDIDITSRRGSELLAAPTAWVFGNEAHGVAAGLREAADAKVRIPLRGRAESLNIATAAAICLHSSAIAHPPAG